MSKIKLHNKQRDIQNEGVKGFMIRVYPSGAMTHAARYIKNKRITIEKVGVLTPAQEKIKFFR